MAGNTGLPFTTKVVFGIGSGAVFLELKIPAYDASNNVCDRDGLVKVRIWSPVCYATKEKLLAPTSYLPRVGRSQLASTVAS